MDTDAEDVVPLANLFVVQAIDRFVFPYGARPGGGQHLIVLSFVALVIPHSALAGACPLTGEKRKSFRKMKDGLEPRRRHIS